MQICPYCGFEAYTIDEEISHMSSHHQEVIDKRLSEAGISNLEDYRQGPDLPSYLTLKELQTVLVFSMKFAVAQEGFYNEDTMIGIHVRDRGTNSPVPASWIEFEVGTRKFALWRHTLDLYEVGPDGAVSDDPIHRND